MSLAALSFFAAPTAAGATDRVVDAATGTNAGDCKVAACKNVTYALFQTVSGDRVVIRPGTYAEQVSVPSGRSLVGTGTPMPTIDGLGGTAVTLDGVAVGVNGLHLLGDTYAVQVKNSATTATITGNTLDDPDSAKKVKIEGGSVQVIGNHFAMPAADSTLSYGIQDDGDKTLDVGFNSFSNFFTSIFADGSTQSRIIHSNSFSGIHGKSPNIGAGVDVYGSAAVTGNVFTAASTANGGAMGISARDFNAPAVDTLSGNRVSGMPGAGIDAEFSVAGSAVSLNEDVVAHNGIGLELFGGDPAVSGATVYDNTSYDIYLGNPSTSLKLTSSIVGAKGVSGAGTCTIAYSRGPTVSGSPCQTFQTAVAPGFAAPTDYHLTGLSPLLDAGDPMAPAAGARDADGRPRAIVGRFAGRCSPARRDIGAYEYAPNPAYVCPPPPDTKAPVLSGVSLPHRIVTGSRVRAKFTLSEPARVTLRFRRALAGVRNGGHCVSLSHSHPAHAQKCTRLVKGGTLAVAAHAGFNKPRLRVKFGKHLPPTGPYRVEIVAADPAHNLSHPAHVRTRLVVPRHHG
jgi:hypothetical protein